MHKSLNRKISRWVIGVFFFSSLSLSAQQQWTPDGNGYYLFSPDRGIETVDVLGKKTPEAFIPPALLIPPGATKPLSVQHFEVSANGELVLLFANTKRVWRENTRGDYWIYNKKINPLSSWGKISRRLL